MKEKIVLIDGHSILSRAFYGIKSSLTNSEGLHTNAIYGFLNILFKVLDDEQPQYLAVAFDMKAPTFRHRMYEAYKGTRKPMPAELTEQVPVLRELLDAMGILVMTLEGYEADDLLGTAARQAEESGLQVIILSGDRDLLQLATDTVCVRIPRTREGKTETDDFFAEDVLAFWHVRPEQVVDLKGLMGDSSDNIPGIPGVGEKTAQKILESFGTIEKAYEHIEEITPPRARQSLQANYELALLSKKLAAIDTDSPYTLDLDAAKLADLATPEAIDLCRRLGLRNMLSRFSESGTADAGQESFEIIRDIQRLQSVKQEILAELKSRAGSKVGISLPGGSCPDGFWAFCVNGERSICLADVGSENITREEAKDFARSVCLEASLVCAVGLKDQLQNLEDIPEDRFFDAKIAAYLLNPLAGAYHYDDIARNYADIRFPAAEELIGKKALQNLDEQQKNQRFAQVCVQEARAGLAARGSLLGALEKQDMEKLFREIEMPLVFTLYRMQREGIAVRREELDTFAMQLTEGIVELESRIYSEAGETFNINSPKQLGQILFEKMGMPYGKKTKTGFSTSADVLEKLSARYPLVSDILEYRQLTKLRSTYAEGLRAFISDDGRIHGRFHQTITATGRISSTDPNLQNIPVRTELGRELRKVFVPREGWLFVDADYSQIELRILAHLSGDPGLIEAYRQERDIHTATASQVFHLPIEEVTDQQRRNAKAVNFGIVYGISSFGLSQGLSITRQEAQEYINLYFETYPGVKQFLDEAVKSAKETGYACTMFGRRRPVPQLHSSNFMERSFGERVAMNSPIQGTAADIIKIAMIRVEQRLRREGMRSRLVLQIHDELLVETWPEEEEQVRTILREEMMGAASLDVNLEIDMHTGKSWYEAK